MAVLKYKKSETQIEEFKLPESSYENSKIVIVSEESAIEPEINIGSDKKNDLVISAIAPHHAKLIRSSGSWILIDNIGKNTFINDEKVTMLQVLKHGDKIRLGNNIVEFYEIEIMKLEKSSKLIGSICAYCGEQPKPGDEVICCPRCATLHHRDCWFNSDKCAKCGYATILTVQLDSYSRLINKECSNCEKVFKRLDKIAYCPECHTPYHSTDDCWFGMVKCKKCGFLRQKNNEN